MSKFKENVLEWILPIVIAILFIVFKTCLENILTNSINTTFTTVIIINTILFGLLILVCFLLYYFNNVNFDWDNSETKEEFDKYKKPFLWINRLILLFSTIWITTLIVFRQDLFLSFSYLGFSFIPLIFCAGLYILNHSMIKEDF